MKKRILIIVLAVVILAGAVGGSLYLRSIKDYKDKVNALTFTEIDLNTVEDGTYFGECDTGVVKAKVEVVVTNHNIDRITLLEHKNGKGKPAEAVISDMIEKQSTDVDAVTGATCSSKIIRKAVENALEGEN
ncbi:MAG: FMN-binding protein [Clostridia bacterium]|nr:FMN-binding protein [Clostridia bacterium]